MLTEEAECSRMLMEEAECSEQQHAYGRSRMLPMLLKEADCSKIHIIAAEQM